MGPAPTAWWTGSAASSSSSPEAPPPPRTGRDGFLGLAFERRAGRTVLTGRRFTLPLQALEPVDLDGTGAATLLLLNPTGGLLGGEEGARIGTPTVAGAKVSAEIVRQGLARKILVFHKKRRKRFRKLRGHRHRMSPIAWSAIYASSWGGISVT